MRCTTLHMTNLHAIVITKYLMITNLISNEAEYSRLKEPVICDNAVAQFDANVQVTSIFLLWSRWSLPQLRKVASTYKTYSKYDDGRSSVVGHRITAPKVQVVTDVISGPLTRSSALPPSGNAHHSLEKFSSRFFEGKKEKEDAFLKQSCVLGGKEGEGRSVSGRTVLFYPMILTYQPALDSHITYSS